MTSTPSGRLRDRIDLGDAASGLALVLIAAWFTTTAARSLAIGTPGRMGPGFFPTMVAVTLGVLGLVIFIRSFGRATETAGLIGPRGLLCILVAPLIFGFGVAPLGFVPAAGIAAFVACYSSGLMTLRFALALSASLTLLSAVLFVWLLKMPAAYFGPWLGF